MNWKSLKPLLGIVSWVTIPSIPAVGIGYVIAHHIIANKALDKVEDEQKELKELIDENIKKLKSKLKKANKDLQDVSDELDSYYFDLML